MSVDSKKKIVIFLAIISVVLFGVVFFEIYISEGISKNDVVPIVENNLEPSGYENTLEVERSDVALNSERVVSSIETLKMSSSEMPMVFEDEVASPPVRKIIAEDINLVFGYVKEYRKYPLKANRNFRTYTVTGEVYESKERIRFLGSVYKPNIFQESNFGDLVNIQGRDYLVIPKQLIDTYTTAIEFAERNSVAFDSLVDFVDTLNTLGKPTIDQGRLSDMFYFLGWNEDYQKNFLERLENNPQFFANNFGGKYKKPSILDVTQAGWFSAVNQESVSDQDLVVEIYRYSNNGLKIGVFSVYKNDMWKILVMPTGR